MNSDRDGEDEEDSDDASHLARGLDKFVFGRKIESNILQYIILKYYLYQEMMTMKTMATISAIPQVMMKTIIMHIAIHMYILLIRLKRTSAKMLIAVM